MKLLIWKNFLRSLRLARAKIKINIIQNKLWRIHTDLLILKENNLELEDRINIILDEYYYKFMRELDSIHKVIEEELEK